MPDFLWEFVQRLPWYDPRRILVTVIQPFRTQVPIVVDGKINPMLVARAQEGYWLQSRVLRIPDRYGFFVSGPPLLQAHEARKVIISTTDGVSPVVGFCLSEAFDLFDTRGGSRRPLSSSPSCSSFRSTWARSFTTPCASRRTTTGKLSARGGAWSGATKWHLPTPWLHQSPRNPLVGVDADPWLNRPCGRGWTWMSKARRRASGSGNSFVDQVEWVYDLCGASTSHSTPLWWRRMYNTPLANLRVKFDDSFAVSG